MSNDSLCMRIFNRNLTTEEGFYPATEIMGFTITWDSRRKAFLSSPTSVARHRKNCAPAPSWEKKNSGKRNVENEYNIVFYFLYLIRRKKKQRIVLIGLQLLREKIIIVPCLINSSYERDKYILIPVSFESIASSQDNDHVYFAKI